jgi:putative tryptophan/tyrosine transport system substrate-binding protein
MPTSFVDTRLNWLRARRMSSWPLPIQRWHRCSRRRAPCRSCSRLLLTLSAPASSQGWRGQAAIPRVFLLYEYSISGKWLELLKQVAPGVTRAAVLRDPATAAGIGQFAAIQAVAPPFGVELSPVDVRDGGEIEQAVTAFAHEPNGGLIVTGSPSQAVHRKLIVSLAARHRLPAVYPFRYMTTEGGLIAYGPEIIDQYRRAANYVDRILKGEKPADLPVQAPTKFELVINMKTAKALGLEVPPTLLARADEVIE